MNFEQLIQESLNKALQPVINRLDAIQQQLSQLEQPEKPYLTRKELKEIYGVTKHRLIKWEQNMLIRGKGNPKLYKREDVIKLMEEVL